MGSIPRTQMQTDNKLSHLDRQLVLLDMEHFSLQLTLLVAWLTMVVISALDHRFLSPHHRCSHWDNNGCDHCSTQPELK